MQNLRNQSVNPYRETHSTICSRICGVQISRLCSDIIHYIKPNWKCTYSPYVEILIHETPCPLPLAFPPFAESLRHGRDELGHGLLLRQWCQHTHPRSVQQQQQQQQRRLRRAADGCALGLFIGFTGRVSLSHALGDPSPPRTSQSSSRWRDSYTLRAAVRIGHSGGEGAAGRLGGVRVDNKSKQRRAVDSSKKHLPNSEPAIKQRADVKTADRFCR